MARTTVTLHEELHRFMITSLSSLRIRNFSEKKIEEQIETYILLPIFFSEKFLILRELRDVIINLYKS